ncbi:TRZ/ATZ family protein [Streptococcus intermedius]|jgi:TRZ/ATZ family hydrolase, putative|uniref:TRZ/ATZ family protein n=1 Tax=Streptococcus intermedius TaxID=1338 RepID=UPI0003908002|nr:TRZ/ATZ family protein [Streptococcus intermedius]AGU77454.1 chlorohydrolase [Streptococcus intermedius C270]ALF27156.1 chlorohydrolase [Streptococcus intermedius]ARC26469.1 TRZ/ATZ family protein [Streptococcus intermedius]MDK8091423.1 TRZ/ATZ family protein [Streptococcus intermedius]PMR92675.1 8-oxoguanine deaminase [Streptococcus intermedius]
MKAFKQVNLVTCDADFHVYRNGLLVIHEDKIVYCGNENATWVDRADEVVDCEGAWLMPGLVNCHTHSAMTTLRGIQDDSNLHEWLEDYIWPAERDFTPEVTTQAVKLALIEMLQTGTTTFNDMYNPNGVEIGQIHEVVAGSKMRCYFSPTLFSSDVETTEETLARTRIIIEEILAYNDERFKVMVAPHAPYSCSKDLLKGSLKLAQELQLKLHIHVAETQAENGMILERYGKRPLAFLKDLGYLEHDGVFAHGVELNEREIAELAVSNIHIAHNPISNLKLASGIAPVTDLVQTGVIVGLATDSVASNNNLDMFEESRTAALLQKMRTGDATQFTIEQALKTMTIEGAKALGMDDQIGSLEVGKQADFLIIQPKGKVHLYPEENMLSHLIYAAKGNDVKDVYIAGEQVVKNGQVLTVELSDL